MCAVKPLVPLAVWQVVGHPALILNSVLLLNLAKHFTHMRLQVFSFSSHVFPDGPILLLDCGGEG